MALGEGCPEHEALELFASHGRLCELERVKREKESSELAALYRQALDEALVAH